MLDGSAPRHLDFQRILEASPEVLLVLLPDSPRFTMVAATEARLRATHTTREQIVGRALFEVFPDNPDDPEATGTSNLRASLERVLESRRPDTMGVQRYDIRHADGSFEAHYWSPKNLPVLGEDGQVLYILHRVEDVTELIRASQVGAELRGRTAEMELEVIRRSQELAATNERLRQAIEKLGRLDRAKTEFFSNVSHEFRTPLTLILGPLEQALASDPPVLSGKQLESVHRNASRLLQLVNGLLDFSRIEAGRYEIHPEPLDLSALTAGLAGAFRSLLEAEGLTFHVDCPPSQRPISVDRGQWEKIVSNLLSNAFKFTFSGSISIVLRDRGDQVELSVRDTGIGIPEEEQSKIFERFHRVEGARGRSFEGSGIGLALVKELVALHGGTIRVTSAPGQGTTFTVCIPAHQQGTRMPTIRATDSGAKPYVEAAAAWDDQPSDQPTESVHDKQRVLVVDDNADMRAYLAGVLGRDWQIFTAGNGREALEAVSRHPPDIVVTDVMMPEMDGFGLLQELRSSPRTAQIPVIVLSAKAGEQAYLEGLDSGANDYLVKPFTARELVARVRTNLASVRARSSALRASENRFRRLAESGIVGIAISDQASRVIEANDVFLAMVGATREDLMNGEVLWNLLPASSGVNIETAGSREGEYERKDGRRIPVLVAIARLDRGDTMSVSLDLTERKRVEAQLLQAQKMEAVGRLAGGVAHDFNNILSIILSYAEMLSMTRADDRALKDDLDEILGAARRARDLTRQLLAFSRQQVIETRITSIGLVVEDMEKMLQRLLGASIKLTTLIDPAAGDVVVDPGQLEQVIMNLAVNAADAMPMGGHLTIQVEDVELGEDYVQSHPHVRPGPYVLLAMTDTGTGMDAATQARIFDPFFTTKEKGKGTGLGLATVFGIVKQSGGHIWVYSEIGQGTVFKVYFPRTDAKDSTAPVQRVVPAAVGGSETILLIEDDPHVRTLARSILRQNGYVVLEAANGGEALLVCEQHGARIDLLLTDVVLPLMSGRQIADRLRALRPGLKVLFMSGYTDDAVLQHGILNSGVAYLQKPVTPGALARKVREVLDSPARPG